MDVTYVEPSTSFYVHSTPEHLFRDTRWAQLNSSKKTLWGIRCVYSVCGRKSLKTLQRNSAASKKSSIKVICQYWPGFICQYGCRIYMYSSAHDTCILNSNEYVMYTNVYYMHMYICYLAVPVFKTTLPRQNLKNDMNKGTNKPFSEWFSWSWVKFT